MGRVGSYPTFSLLLPKRAATSLCCTCPEVALGGRYPLSLPLEPGLSSHGAFRLPRAAVRPGRGNIVPQSVRIVKYPCKFFWERIYCKQKVVNSDLTGCCNCAPNTLSWERVARRSRDGCGKWLHFAFPPPPFGHPLPGRGYYQTAR